MILREQKEAPLRSLNKPHERRNATDDLSGMWTSTLMRSMSAFG